jgi:hypothetical protein
VELHHGVLVCMIIAHEEVDVINVQQVTELA